MEEATEYTFISLRVTTEEKEALRTAANKEKRSLSAYLLNSGLDRAKEKFDIEPKYEGEAVLKEK